MAIVPDVIEITRVADGETVEASVVKLTRQLAQTEIDTKWWQLTGIPKNLREKEMDHGYKWSKRIGELVNNRWCDTRGVQTDDGRIQGAVLYWLNKLSFVEENAGAIFVESLATAPRNRDWLVTTPAYRGVGSGLLRSVVIHSYLLGLGGRVNLFAANDAASISFYMAKGFMLAGYDGDEDEEKLPRLELSAKAAQRWLRVEGYEL